VVAYILNNYYLKMSSLNAYVVECVRTAGGKKNGALSGWHPVDLGAAAINELLERSKIPPAEVEDVICGCVSQVGAQGANLGRMCVLASKLPVEVPGTVVDRQCGSSLQAIHFAAQAVMSGTNDVVIAMGVESMSKVPIGASIVDGLKAGHGRPEDSAGIQQNWGEGVQFSQFAGAEMLAKKYNLTKQELDEFGYQSHIKAAKAIKEGKFKKEIFPLKGKTKDGKEIVHAQDEGVRPDVTLESMVKLKTLQEGGVITAATSSQICDGASAMLIVNERGLKKLGLKPRAKVLALGLAGSDPRIMLEGPIPATKNVLKRAGLTIDQIGLYEVNEAFAPVPLSWMKALNADPKKMNVNGGAIALGHPLGSTGVKITTTLINEMERRGERYGIVAICEGGGTSNATIFELCKDLSKL
jgi:acetyl-CoA acetyltransferase family protein